MPAKIGCHVRFFFPKYVIFPLFFMKIFVADADIPSASRLERPLTMAGFDCEKFASQKVFSDFLLHHPGSKGVLITGAGISDEVRPVWIGQLYEFAGPLPVLVAADAEKRDAIASSRRIGMQDYICLPIRPRELVTRVSLLVRQAYPDDYDASVLVNGPYVFSRFPNRALFAGKEIVLTVKEFNLARLFFEHIGQPLSRLTIRETIWSSSENESGRTVDTHVSRVRNKLGLTEGNGYVLQQVYGYGYCLVQG
ncbi:hypothetical protein OFAG_00503 [Oxalobacter formigenes HOxBLS]|uniref:OmpR/PhoB-type domain-containing protein n=2 Tax=Oxalobacter paraformigenes TaxID=556268 RepID=C3X2B4_9BURK|nr:hypothetical protein OFAG_00503 [Oxalobacter paraformigenes]